MFCNAKMNNCNFLFFFLKKKIVVEASDIDDDSLLFEPKFVHQTFESELISGYKGLFFE
jgi:hypothetical protein